jgi:hypothetical protein
MTKPEIIHQVLNDFRDESEGAYIPERSDIDYEPIILSALEKSLQTVGPDTDIRTCEDFGLLNVTCCESCHGLYQNYEMSLVEIESAGNAWIDADKPHALPACSDLSYFSEARAFSHAAVASQQCSYTISVKIHYSLAKGVRALLGNF